MFIFINHGDNEQFLVNPNCSVRRLLCYVRSKVGLSKRDTVDLCDETGTMKMFFMTKTPEEYASQFLTTRSTYYICKVERGGQGPGLQNSYKAFVPLLTNPEPELLEALRTQCEALERNRLKLLRIQEARKKAILAKKAAQAKKAVPIKSAMASPSKSSGRSGGDRPPRKTVIFKTKPEVLNKKDKRR